MNMNLFKRFAFKFLILSMLSVCWGDSSEGKGGQLSLASSDHQNVLYDGEISIPVQGLDTFEVGMVNPKGVFYWLKADGIYCPSVSYVDSALVIEVGNGFGVVEVDNNLVQDRMFSMSGKYTVLVADNLETELDNSFSLSYEFNIDEGALRKILDDKEYSDADNEYCKID